MPDVRGPRRCRSWRGCRAVARPARVGADGVVHGGVEAIVHVVSTRSRPGLDARIFSNASTHSPGGVPRAGAIIEERAQARGIAASAEELDGVKAVRLAELGRTSSLRGVNSARLPTPSMPSKYSSARFHAVPVEARQEIADSGRAASRQAGVGEVHEEPPVDVGVLEAGGFLAPLGMVGQKRRLIWGGSSQA